MGSCISNSSVSVAVEPYVTGPQSTTYHLVGESDSKDDAMQGRDDSLAHLMVPISGATKIPYPSGYHIHPTDQILSTLAIEGLTKGYTSTDLTMLIQSTSSKFCSHVISVFPHICYCTSPSCFFTILVKKHLRHCCKAELCPVYQIVSTYMRNLVDEDAEYGTLNPESFKGIKTSNTEEIADRCAICINDFKKGHYIDTLPCGHKFHSRCCSDCMKKSSKCPMCRHELNEGVSGIIKIYEEEIIVSAMAGLLSGLYGPSSGSTSGFLSSAPASLFPGGPASTSITNESDFGGTGSSSASTESEMLNILELLSTLMPGTQPEAPAESISESVFGPES